MQDAFNLGWKLAAVVTGRAEPELLDTYHSERHPVGAAVLRNTQAQGVLLVPDPDVIALRAMVTGMLSCPDANRLIAGVVSGLGIRYEMPGAPGHPLVGARLPGVDLPTGRGLLWHREPALERLVKPWHQQVDVAGGLPDGDAEAVLARPDGHVCWAGAATDTGLEAALRRWFGRPAQGPTVHCGSPTGASGPVHVTGSRCTP